MNSTLRQKGLSVNLQRRFWTKTLGIPKKVNWEHFTCIFGLTGCFHGILPPKNWFLALVIIFMNFHWPLSLRWKYDISSFTRYVLYASGLELSFLHSLWVYNCTTSSFHYFVFPEYASGELMHSPLYPRVGSFRSQSWCLIATGAGFVKIWNVGSCQLEEKNIPVTSDE